MDVLGEAKTGLVILVLMTLLTGVIYPATVTVVAQAVFPHQANGSLIGSGEAARGSELIGQSFSGPGYFWGRLSATSPFPYNAAASSGSNLGPLNPVLRQTAAARIAALKAADPGNTSPIPVDLVTSSASGLDPEISVAAALYQALRVAGTRGVDEARVTALIERCTRGRQLGILGEPGVNVLCLNLGLDALR
jgi:potassium-transporting ATPase KdpC subunit